jgi:hypothetical protein
MSNPYTTFDKWLGRKLYKLNVKMDATNVRKYGYMIEVIPKIVWHKREKDWKYYGLTYNEIAGVVNEHFRIKPLKGFRLWLNINKARSSISDSIKKKNIVFKDDNHVNYTNTKYGFRDFTTTVDDLARIFIERYRIGIPKEKLVEIFKQEYNKRRKN